MKKICHVTSVHPEEDGRIFRRACISSVKAGYDTFIVEQGESYEKDGVHIIGIGKPKKKGRLYRMTVFSRKAIKAANDLDADLYQLHDPELLPYALKLKKQGKAVVFDSHEDYSEQLKNKTYLPRIICRIISFIYTRYSDRIFSKIDGLTYPGNEGEPSVFDGKCKLVSATDNLPWLSELYDKYDPNIERDDDSVCYIGALDESRGITQIIEASYDAGCTLYLAGIFYSDSYKKQLQNKKEFECVKYLGTVDRNQVFTILQKCKIGLCTLLDVGQYHKMNNLPTKVYEYMSMGVPVIINESPYNIAINNKLKFGICVNPASRTEIKEAIERLMSDQQLCNKLGNNGRKAIKERFSWDVAQHNLIDMYKKILGE